MQKKFFPDSLVHRYLTHKYRQFVVKNFPYLTENPNYNETVELSGWRLAFGSQKVNSLLDCLVNI